MMLERDDTESREGEWGNPGCHRVSIRFRIANDLLLIGVPGVRRSRRPASTTVAAGSHEFEPC